MNVGKSVVIKGELHGSEDLTIEGQVEGKIKAQVFAKVLVVLDAVNDTIAVSERGDIRDGGAVDSDIVSPRVAIAEDAYFCGSVDMQRQSVPPRQAQQPYNAAALAGYVAPCAAIVGRLVPVAWTRPAAHRGAVSGPQRAPGPRPRGPTAQGETHGR